MRINKIEVIYLPLGNPGVIDPLTQLSGPLNQDASLGVKVTIERQLTETRLREGARYLPDQEQHGAFKRYRHHEPSPVQLLEDTKVLLDTVRFFEEDTLLADGVPVKEVLQEP